MLCGVGAQLFYTNLFSNSRQYCITRGHATSYTFTASSQPHAYAYASRQLYSPARACARGWRRTPRRLARARGVADGGGGVKHVYRGRWRPTAQSRYRERQIRPGLPRQPTRGRTASIEPREWWTCVLGACAMYVNIVERVTGGWRWRELSRRCTRATSRSSRMPAACLSTAGSAPSFFASLSRGSSFFFAAAPEVYTDFALEPTLQQEGAAVTTAWYTGAYTGIVQRDVEARLWTNHGLARRRRNGPSAWDELIGGGVYTHDLRRALRGQGCSLDQNETASLFSAVQGREWPQARRHRAFENVDSSLCKRCLQGEGTEAHRLWWCPCDEAKRLQFFSDDPGIIGEARLATAQNSTHPFWTRGLMPHSWMSIPVYQQHRCRD